MQKKTKDRKKFSALVSALRPRHSKNPKPQSHHHKILTSMNFRWGRFRRSRFVISALGTIPRNDIYKKMDRPVDGAVSKYQLLRTLGPSIFICQKNNTSEPRFLAASFICQILYQNLSINCVNRFFSTVLIHILKKNKI